ncbi:zinc finger protein on ecdysone puffs isoform X2 [Anabrus simplex]|uniref:zinc finger protein on ecdysone puffs isoform X2 n=1 Tax=Anabrus simplex TaxID=316456 RepID=UPI0034DD6ADE
MSQNRGYRRDNRSSYQLGNYGGRSGSQMNVNPWEGGMVPGGMRSGVAGLLPTPPQSGNLISQLSSPEAQLAIASNLLTTLLRPQQQQNQVPSLLSLGALGQVGNVGASYRQSGYGQDQGRYQDRGQNRRSGRMDERRGEPYGKGRHPTSSKGGPERKSGGQGYRSPIGKNRPASGSKVGSKAEKKDDKDAQKDKEEDKGNGDLNKEEDVKREDGEEGEEGNKRDWKKEKKDDDDDEMEGDGGKRESGKKSSSRYHGIPDNFFFCHVCKKHMWDDHSFENHLKGRTHLLMMDKLDESYKIKVELMRHELKVAEQQREIEMERIKRQGRKVHMALREYCTMCDLHFYGNIVVHRKNERHQQLKSFLHPKCGPCGKEFASRIEWDHHKLTPLHLRKAAETHKNRQPDSDDEFGIEELIAQGNGDRYSKKDMKVRSKEDEEKDILEMEKSEKEGEKDEDAKEEEGKEENDKGEAKPEGVAEDATAGAKGNERVRIPKYNPDVAIASNLVKNISGFTCRACRRFFVNEEDSQTHCRTLTHYNNYVTLLKMKLQARAAQQKREGKNKRNAEEKVDDEGNWKRRKVSDEKDDDEDGTQASEGSKGDEEMKEVTAESKKNGVVSSGEEKYDPLEADAEAEAEGETKESDSKPAPAKAEEEKIWSEVDRDIGNLLETVDEEGDESEMNEQAENEDQPRQEQDAKDEKTSPRSTRGSTAAASNRGSPARGRGRKRK